jgi:hypothetical protein
LVDRSRTGSVTGVRVVTGEADAAAARGQNRSLNPAGSALRNVPLSRCSRLPRPLMLNPVSRTRRLMKLMTTGAAIAINVEVTLGPSPDSRLMPFITVLSLLPNRLESTRLPAASSGELGSVMPLAIWLHETSPVLPVAVSSTLRSALESSDLLARPPSSVAVAASMALDTECSDCPSAPAIEPTVWVSSVFSIEANSESAITSLLP